MLAVRTTGPCLELPVVSRGLGVLSTPAITVMVDAANARFDDNLRRLLALQRAFEAFAAAPGAGGDATLDDADT